MHEWAFVNAHSCIYTLFLHVYAHELLNIREAS